MSPAIRRRKPEPADDSALIGTAEAARILGVDRRTLTRWAQHQQIMPVTRVGGGPHGSLLFSRDAVQRLARRQRGADT